jgi:hypothetical protein
MSFQLVTKTNNEMEEIFMNWMVWVILALVAIIIIGAVIIVPVLKKKGISPAEVFKRSREVICDVDNSVDTLAQAFPNYPALVRMGYILEYCKAAVTVAEQRYLTNEIAGTARKDVAIQYVKNILSEEGIEVSPVMDKIIEDSIKGAVGALPPTTPQIEARGELPPPATEQTAQQMEGI